MVELTDAAMVLAVAAVALIAGVLAAVAGFGGAVMMLPVLVAAFGVREAIPILTVAQLVSNLSRVWFNRRDLALPVVAWFSLGAVPTAVAGGIVFATAPAAALVRLLGVFLIGMVLYRHTTWGRQTGISLKGFLPLGVASGFLSALLGTVGPLAAPFFLSYGLIKGAYIGTEALTAVVMHVTKLGVYGGAALLSGQAIITGLAVGAVLFLGSFIGKQVLDRVPDRIFPYLIEAVLAATGILFVVRG